MLIKKFNFTQKEIYNLKVLVFRNKKFFVLKRCDENKSTYLIIPSFIKVELKDSIVIFSVNNKSFSQFLQNFYNSFIFFLKNNEKTFYKKLLLKGLGFKITIFRRLNFTTNFRILRLKIGYSHFVYVEIPTQLLVSTNKKRTRIK
jgi:ribosomal protein L6P/L9E